MAEKRKYPPSVKRYRDKNPTISIVLTKETKEALDTYRGDRSYSTALKDLIVESRIFLQGRTYEMGKSEGLETGYSRARQEFEIKIPCKYCNELVTIDPSNKLSMGLVVKGLQNNSFPHKECVEPGNRER